MDPAEQQKHQVRRFYAEIWNQQDMTVLPEIMAADVTFRGSLGSVRTGHAEFAAYVREVTGALAGYRCDIERLLSADDQAVAKMLFSGEHRAELLGVPATGRQVSWAGAAFFTFRGGLVGDLWVLGDLANLRAQLTS
ncbi:steroid delta-isomerase-like uncharacterized protein [Tamaricihabitans halophyticus]|uniref:Steroid delta-isomerase-like uncharacterized protein n=1 Tax=Tamaricihabitans halophyticus TaxID=1262583 RepID=A0A4R2Q7H5_9PSEU|nr:ester cyclase [Tamaricihabitans halophyticus]TCP43858.1 steroid delta-isomerase-like uncharacterized protein [Tamaricihabitans halophyticus]